MGRVTKFQQDVTLYDDDVTPVMTMDELADAIDAASAGDETEWSRELVMERLEDAICLVHRTVSRAGPKGFGSAMPEYEYSDIDRWWQMTQTAEERERGDFERNRPKIGATSDEIQAADQALAWVQRFVPDERERRALNSWLLAKATRRPWKKVTKDLGRNHRTAISRRDRAIAHIVFGLMEEEADRQQEASTDEG